MAKAMAGPGQAARFNPGTGEQWAQCVGCGGWTLGGRRCARCEAEAWCALNCHEAQAARDSDDPAIWAPPDSCRGCGVQFDGPSYENPAGRWCGDCREAGYDLEGGE